MPQWPRSHFSEKDLGPLCTPGIPRRGALQHVIPTHQPRSPTLGAFLRVCRQQLRSHSTGRDVYADPPVSLATRSKWYPSAILRDFTLALAQLQGMVCCYPLPCFPTTLRRRTDTGIITLPFAGVQSHTKADIIITFCLPDCIMMLGFVVSYHILFHSNKF